MTNTSRTTLCHVFCFVLFCFFATALTYKDLMTRSLSNLLSTHFQGGGRGENGLFFFRHNGKGEDPGDEAAIPFLGGILCLKVAFYHLISVKLKAYSFFSFLM